MKKFFSLVLALVMALSLTTVAWGATTHEVSTEAQLAELLDEDGTNDVAEGDTIKLLNDIQVLTPMHSTNGVSYTGGKSFTIDFNNFSVSADSSITNAIFRIKTSGTVTLMNGTITASDVYYGFLANGTGTINLDNMTISLTNTGGQGVAVMAYAGTVNVNYGTDITAAGAYAGMEVCGTANIYEGSTVSYVGNVPTPNTYGSIGSAVGTSGGTLNIYGGELESTATGGNTVATNSSGGTINITGGTITGETAVFALTDSYYNDPAEINISGGTINGALAETAYGTASTEVTVSGGIFDTNVNAYLATGYETAEVGSTGGTFVVGQDIEVDANGKITAGTFATLPDEDYLADGVTFVGNSVEPAKKTTAYDDLYAKDTDLSAAAPTTPVDIVVTPAKAPKYNKTTGALETLGWVEHVNITGDGTDYVFVNSLADADVVLYKDAAGKQAKFYLAAVVTPEYAEGVLFTKFGEDCGEVDYPDYDKTDVYFTAKGDFAGEIVVADEDGAFNVMYGGKLVAVDFIGYSVEDDAIDHKSVYTIKNGVTLSIECGVCGAKAVKAANVLSLPKGADVVTGESVWYWPAAADTTTEEPKVESAETFDAGIAMYVGMSVMAAAGSAVVIGKKKD